MAGLSAAARARELGAMPAAYEKGTRPGGSMLLSSCVIWRFRDWDDFRAECPTGDEGLQRVVVQDVPRTRARLLRGRLHEVVLRPRHLAGKELFAGLVVDTRESTVELRERDELTLGEIRVRHVAPVELVQSC